MMEEERDRDTPRGQAKWRLAPGHLGGRMRQNTGRLWQNTRIFGFNHPRPEPLTALQLPVLV
jgi:hypothetical protein